MRRLVYILSDIRKSLNFEWTIVHLKSRFDLIVIVIGEDDTPFIKFLRNENVDTRVVADARYTTTFSKWIHVFRLLRELQPDIVHCHLWRAMLIGLSASWLAGVKRRIFTRHHAAIHYDEFPSGRKWDRFCNSLATDIVAISGNVRYFLVEKDKANSSKVRVIHHGFDLDYFIKVSDESVKSIREKYRIGSRRPVIGVISRYLELKGFQYIIPAFRELLQQHPGACLVIANAYGPYEPVVRGLLNTLPEHSYVEIEFETDLAALYRLFDVFVHVPITRESEAFGQIYVEPMLCSVPCVFTLSGVAPDFVVDERNALVVPHRSVRELTEAVHRLLVDKELSARLITQGLHDAQAFSVTHMFEKLDELYG